MAAAADRPSGPPLTFWQRRALRALAKEAHKRPGEPLSPEDWEAYFRFAAQPGSRAMKRFMRSLPSTPRCGFCSAPFAGAGARLVRPLGYRPSRKNPNICATCVELAPPGGMTTEAGVLFADVRGFTTLSEELGPESTSALLRRFYASAESVLFPEALIDKVVGDEVMAVYLPAFVRPLSRDPHDDDHRLVAELMVRHARELLERIGYGTPGGPFAMVGVGLDYGEVFIGNIGDGAVQDFTAVGDVVNTASRLQAHAAGGEVLVSARLAAHLDMPLGTPEEQVAVKGKPEPVAAHRLSWFDSAPR